MGAFHYRVLREDPRFTLVAVVDPVVASLPDGASIPLLRHLSQVADLAYDLAVIAAPTEWHDSLVAEALDQGRHVFVEKPAASTPEKALSLVTIAESKGLYLAVGHVERCNPVVASLQKVLASGILGRLIHVSATRAGGWPRAVKPGNNVIVDLAVHELDVFRLLLGPLSIVHSVGHSTREEGIFDTAELSLVSLLGVSATIHVNWHTPQRIRTIRVTGTAGVAHVDYIQQTLQIVGKQLAQHPAVADLGASVTTDPQGLDCLSIPIQARESLKRQLDEVFAMLSGQAHQLATGDELIESIYLLSEAQRQALVPAPISMPDGVASLRGSRLVIPNA
jgi:UDP-N-acetylglucosamine 3-dehydrogenase